jgi:hypothetical protein
VSIPLRAQGWLAVVGKDSRRRTVYARLIPLAGPSCPGLASLLPVTSARAAFRSCRRSADWVNYPPPHWCRVTARRLTRGDPTSDKPTVVFQPPPDADRVSHAMTLRVADCQAAYEALRSRGATFLTPPHDWGTEIRCFLRDPDGHLVEISQSKVS